MNFLRTENFHLHVLGTQSLLTLVVSCCGLRLFTVDRYPYFDYARCTLAGNCIQLDYSGIRSMFTRVNLHSLAG